jgi:hypothetical protein
MSYSRRLIISCCLFIASNAYAFDAFVDALYWRATETADWALTNNLSPTNQVINLQTIAFDFKPGFRVGVGHQGEWDTKLYYTYYYTHATDSVTGNVVSGFLGGKIVQTPGGGIFFYTAGQVDFSINFQMLDYDLGKRFYVSKALVLRPVIGVRAGRIKQNINTSFQGAVSVNENVINNFKGIGPKAAIESKWILRNCNDYKLSIFADFTSSFMWGSWYISDAVHDTADTTLYISVGSRHMGAFALQGFMGLDFDYKHLTMKLGYEVADWFDQYQVLDDGTGAHNTDLVLQGITLRLSYCF